MRQDAKRLPVIDLFSIGSDTGLIPIELLRRNNVVAKPRDLGDREDAPPPIRLTADLHDEVDRIRDLAPQAHLAALIAGETREHFKPVEALPWRARVDR